MKMPNKLAVTLTGEFTASELDEIIRDLAMARAGMLPAVPTSAPGDISAEGEVLVQDAASFTCRTLASGGLRIYLRSDGLGWMAYNLTPRDVAGIRELILKSPGDGRTAH